MERGTDLFVDVAVEESMDYVAERGTDIHAELELWSFHFLDVSNRIILSSSNGTS